MLPRNSLQLQRQLEFPSGLKVPSKLQSPSLSPHDHGADGETVYPGLSALFLLMVGVCLSSTKHAYQVFSWRSIVLFVATEVQRLGIVNFAQAGTDF